MTSPNNLPLPLNSIVGRQVQIGEVTRLLSGTRLLTLTGVGGSGKTRLSLAVADELVQAYPDGVWFVELAPLSDPALVPQSLAQVLSVQEAPSQPLIETLAAYLKPRDVLLVLDNCEHLVAACARLVEALLRTCPHLRILCTSREPLGVVGEMVYLVPVLPVPNLQEPPGTASAYMRFEAVQLFVERASAARPSLVLTEQNATAVAQICHQLDGIPLAIELAASQTRVLSVAEIAARLADGFGWLTTGARTAPLRQQTLQAALDWSYALLTPPEQSLLMNLSVFAGGCTLAAVEAVCREWDAPVLDFLSRLVDKSLVIANVIEGQDSRYRLLEPVRQYALYRLYSSGDYAEVRDRHLCFYLEWAEAAEPELHGLQQVSWLNSLEVDHDNLRAAFEWALERNPTSPFDELRAAPLRLANALPSFWRMHSHVSEGRRRLAAVLARIEAAPDLLPARAAALEQAAWLAMDQSDFDETARLAEQSLALYRSLNDAWGIARSLYHLSVAATHHNEFALAQALIDESLRLWQAVGDPEGVALALERIGLLAIHRGDYSRARQVLEQAVGLWRQQGHLWGIAWSQALNGRAAVGLRDFGSAQSCLTEALPIFQALGDRRGAAGCIETLGEVRLGTGDLANAGAYYLEALALFQRVGNRWSMAHCLQKLGMVASMQHRWEQAARLFGAGHALREVIHSHVNPIESIDFDRQIRRTSEALGKHRFAAAWQAGQAMTIEDAIAFALTQAELAKPAPQTPLQAAKAPFDGLTARERQVAALVALGRSNREIAEMLVLTERTVAVHVSNILAKLDFTSRTQIAAWAIARGLVE